MTARTAFLTSISRRRTNASKRESATTRVPCIMEARREIVDQVQSRDGRAKRGLAGLKYVLKINRSAGPHVVHPWRAYGPVLIESDAGLRKRVTECPSAAHSFLNAFSSPPLPLEHTPSVVFSQRPRPDLAPTAPRQHRRSPVAAAALLKHRITLRPLPIPVHGLQSR